MTTIETPKPSAGPIPTMPQALETQKHSAFEQGKTDCRENQHVNPFPYASLAYFAWRRGHDSISCDECGGKRTQLRCPQCNSDDVKSWEFDNGIDQESGYQDAGERARCQVCHFRGDADEFQMPCILCNGTGIDPEAVPNYLGEAFLIAAGQSETAVRREHLVAVVEHCRKLVAAAIALPEIKEVA